VLEATELDCERGGRNLFRALSFALQPGDVLRIAGANGSGKTSLLRILCGLLAPTRGQVKWRGNDIGALREEYATQLVYLGHAPAVKDDLSGAENLAIACRLAGDAQAGEAISSALGRFRVPDSPVKKMSQGQRRRAALARLALSARQPLWLLDEPFSALDPEGIGILKETIESHRARGGAVVFTTHQDAAIAGARVIELG
jgi:heme exporter protein A